MARHFSTKLVLLSGLLAATSAWADPAFDCVATKTSTSGGVQVFKFSLDTLFSTVSGSMEIPLDKLDASFSLETELRKNKFYYRAHLIAYDSKKSWIGDAMFETTSREDDSLNLQVSVAQPEQSGIQLQCNRKTAQPADANPPKF